MFLVFNTDLELDYYLDFVLGLINKFDLDLELKFDLKLGLNLGFDPSVDPPADYLLVWEPDDSWELEDTLLETILIINNSLIVIKQIENNKSDRYF